MIRGPARLAALLLVLALGGTLAAACGTSAKRVGTVQRKPSAVARTEGGRPSHIAVIVMENEEYGDVIGSHAAPYLNGLASPLRAGQLDVRDYPSLAAQLPGADRRLDVRDQQRLHLLHVRATSIVDQLDRGAHLLEAYMEDLPRPCFNGAERRRIRQKHDPFMYYTRISGQPVAVRHVVAADRAASDERSGTLPRFIWITPNLCHDMHDCSVAHGDRFLVAPGTHPCCGRWGRTGCCS